MSTKLDEISLEQGEQDFELYEFGRKMRGVVVSPAWPDLVEFVEQYVNDIDLAYRRLPPGDPGVIGAHAAVHALDEFLRKFKEDLPKAVEFVEHPSPEFQRYLYNLSEATDVAKAMGI
jgi:hypothetical protein